MAASHAPSALDPERDFERLRLSARRRFLARARRAAQAGHIDLDAAADDGAQQQRGPFARGQDGKRVANRRQRLALLEDGVRLGAARGL